LGLFDNFFSWEFFLFGPSATALAKGDARELSPATKFATTGDSSSGAAPASSPTVSSADGLDEWKQQQLDAYKAQLTKGKEDTLTGGLDDKAKENLRIYGDSLQLKIDERRASRKKEYDEAQVALRAASRRRAREFASRAGTTTPRGRGGSSSLMGTSYTPTLMGR
jgi:hypothetical protein